MDKIKKIEDFLDKMQGLLDNAKKQGNIIIRVEDLEAAFPELRESEDERIRKNIISWLKNIEGQTIPINDYNSAIAWLERQCKKTNPYGGVSFEYNGNTWGMCARDNGVDILLDKQLFKHLEKQGEQKEINLIEILKHYPKETELYSPLYGKLWLAEVDEKHEIITCYKHPLDKGCTRAIIAQEDTVCFFSNGTTGLPDYTVSKDCMLFLYNFEKQGEQEQTMDYPDNLPKDNWELVHEFVEKFGRIPKDEDELNALVEYVVKRQKPTECNDEDELSCFESALFTAFSYAWQSYLLGEEVNVKRWAKEQSKELLEAAKEELKGHNYAWSKEDKEKLDRIISIIHCYTGTVQEENELKFWLKSLKDRVGCEANCTTTKAWSEEDIATISRVISIVKWAAYSDHSHPILNDEGATELVERLNSIKERHTWKPSDEQIKVCKEVYADLLSVKGCNVGTVNSEINRLEEQLKKLKDK